MNIELTKRNLYHENSIVARRLPLKALTPIEYLLAVKKSKCQTINVTPGMDINRVITEAGEYDTLVFNRGRYETDQIVVEKDNLELVFRDSATIVQNKAFGSNSCLFRLRGCSGVNMRGYGAILRMYRDKYRSTTGQRHVVSLEGCTDINIEGMRLAGAGGDGIYVGRGAIQHHCENVSIKNCMIDDNWRNAISVVSVKGLTVDGCTLSNTYGGSPRTGFFVEPDHEYESLQRIIVKNTIIRDNDWRGIHLNFDNCRDTCPIDITFNTVIIDGTNLYHGIEINNAWDGCTSGIVKFKYVHVKNCQNGISINLKDASGVQIEYDRCIIEGVRNGFPVSHYLGKEIPVGGIKYNDVQVLTNWPAVGVGNKGQRPAYDIHGQIYTRGPEQKTIEWGGDLHDVDLAVKTGTMPSYYYTRNKIAGLLKTKK